MPPINPLFLALAGGFISAVVFASATTGPMVLRLALYFLTPLPLYLAGLGIGPAAAAIAAISATVVILLLADPLTAFLYALTSGIPAVGASRLALLSRGEGENQEWYPVGRIVAAAALFGAVFSVLVITISGVDIEALTKVLRDGLAEFVKTQVATVPGAPAITEAQIDELAKTTLKTLPWALGGLAMATILFNMWLAGRITHASGRLVRPWPDLAAFELPPGTIFAFLGALLLTFLGGYPALLAGGLAGALLIAFALIGLASAHTLTRGSPWRNFVLSALYAALVIFTAPALALLAIVGLAETVFGYRAIAPRGPPDSKN